MTINPVQKNNVLKYHAWHKTAILLITGLISSTVLYAQEMQAGQAAPLFQSEETLNLELKADFNKVFSVKDDSTYFPARLSWTDDAGLKKEIDIKIRTRGNARRNKDVCRFTPLRLNFPKEATKGTPFEGQKNIKLVTHCDRADFYEQNTMVEYLIYKAFNILSDSSFKVRPAMINYVYTGGKTDTLRKFAFFIEPEKYLAGRLHGIEIKSGKIHPDRWDPSQTCLVDMFQYMIGNTDYSIYELHNIAMFQDSVNKFPTLPVPFDFDFSGLVSANYAVPNPMMNTRTCDRKGLSRF